MFTVFLCCRSSTTADDDSQPAPRTAATQKRDAQPSPPGKEPVAKLPQKDTVTAAPAAAPAISTAEDVDMSEKISEKLPPKTEPAKMAPVVLADPAAATTPVATATEKAPVEDAVPTPTPNAPVVIEVESPTPPAVAEKEHAAALPEALAAPVVPEVAEKPDTDADTIEETRAEQKVEVPEPVYIAPVEKEENEAGANRSDEEEAEEHVPRDAPADSATGKGRSWLLAPLRPEFEGKKCLVLDLDETLVHSSFKVRSAIPAF